MRISEFPILTFDTYGTLIDWETGIWTALQPLLRRLPDPPGREPALAEFAEHESGRQAAAPSLRYSDLLTKVHGNLARQWGADPDPEEDARFGGAVGDWPAFADAARSLAWLKPHYKLITLTNCDRASYRGSSRRLGDPWDAIYTAEDVGAYKPSPKNFAFLLERVAEDFGSGPESVLHIAQSLFHDHVPAKEIGLTTVWIDRRAGRGGGATARPEREVTPDWRFGSMDELADRFRQERGHG